MNTKSTRNSAFVIFGLIGTLAFGGCSQKPSSEEVAAQVKAALAEEKAKEQAAASAPAPAPVAEPAAAAPAPTPAAKPAAKSKRVAHAEPAPAAPVPEAAAPVHKFVCTNCGVVVSVKEIEQAGKGSGLGAIAGGVAGGVVGHQIGQGTGKDLATIAGALGGALAGNKVEENVKKIKVYDVTVRMENGEQRVLRQETAPSVVAGDNVKIENDHVVRQ